MARLTWQNVSAPASPDLADIALRSGVLINSAFGSMANVADTVRDRRIDANSNAELMRLLQVGSANQVDPYLQEAATRIDPSQMNETLRNAVAGLRSTAQGYDSRNQSLESQRLNQQVTREQLSQTQQDNQFNNDLRKQNVAYNQAMLDAGVKAAQGDNVEARRIMSEAATANPLAAANKGLTGLEADRQTVASNSLATSLQEEVFKESDLQLSPENATAAAYQKAIQLGATPQQADQVSKLAAERLNRQANSDELIRTTPATPREVLSASTGSTTTTDTNQQKQTTTQNQPTEGSAASRVASTFTNLPVTGSNRSVLSGEAPATSFDLETVSDLPIINPSTGNVSADPNDLVTYTDQDIELNAAKNPNGLLNAANAATERYVLGTRALGTQDSTYRALDILDNMTDSETPEQVLNNMFTDLDEDSKQAAKAKMRVGVQELVRRTGISDEMAMAALLSTADTRNWLYLRDNNLSPNYAAATEVANNIKKGTVRDGYNSYKQSKQAATNASAYRDRANTQRNLIKQISEGTGRFSNYSAEDRQKQLDLVTRQYSQTIKELNKLLKQADDQLSVANNISPTGIANANREASLARNTLSGTTRQDGVEDFYYQQAVDPFSGIR